MSQQTRREHWTNVLEQQQQSGLNIKQFCLVQNISYQTFYYWSRKLSQPDPETKVHPIVVTDTAASTSCVVLTLNNGVRAELPTTLNPQQIRHWVEALQ